MVAFINLNGQLVAPHQAHVSISDRGFLLGDGIFETFRVKNGVALDMAAHMERLTVGSQILGFPLDVSGFPQEIEKTIAVNEVQDGIVRLTISRGEGLRGPLPPVNPDLTIVITTAAMPLSQHPISLRIVHCTRRNQFSPLSRVKTLSYLENILIRQEACQNGCDDGIVLNTMGQIAETSIGNLVFRLDGKWLTPPLTDGVVQGTARERLLAAGLIAERSIEVDDLKTVEAAMMINALSLRAIFRIDDQDISLPEKQEEHAFRICLDL